MSVYNGNIKSWTINPVFDASLLRSEFRLLPDKLYLSNLRVLNIGSVVALPVGVPDNGTTRYNLLAGAHGIIKNIFLMDGSQILDQVLNYNAWEGFKNYNRSNSQNCDVEKMTDRHGLGFVFDRTNAINNSTNKYEGPKVKEFFPNAPNKPTADRSQTPMAYLKLREVFPLLQSLQFLPTGIFKNLRVVVEYSPLNALQVSTNGITVAGTTVPILVCDEILNEKLKEQFEKEFKGVSWNAIEMETVHVEAVPASTDADFAKLPQTQKTLYRLNGFNNKTLNRLLCQKQATTNPSNIYQALGSESMQKELFQVVVNGSNVVPITGINSPSMRLALMHDTWGTCNAQPCSNSLAVYGCKNFIENVEGRIGRLDYMGLAIKEKIKTLQVEYDRYIPYVTGVSPDPTTIQALSLNFWGEVAKAVVVKNGAYSVMYL